MHDELIRETIDLLRRHIEPDTAVHLRLSEEGLGDFARMLYEYRLSRARKIAILGGYMLLRLSVRRHCELTVRDRLALTRSILDGDYFTGLYFQFLARCSEHRLLAYLAPVHKQIQIGLIGGETFEQVMAELVSRIRQYLDEHCK